MSQNPKSHHQHQFMTVIVICLLLLLPSFNPLLIPQSPPSLLTWCNDAWCIYWRSAWLCLVKRVQTTKVIKSATVQFNIRAWPFKGSHFFKSFLIVESRRTTVHNSRIKCNGPLCARVYWPIHLAHWTRIASERNKKAPSSMLRETFGSWSTQNPSKWRREIINCQHLVSVWFWNSNKGNEDLSTWGRKIRLRIKSHCCSVSNFLLAFFSSLIWTIWCRSESTAISLWARSFRCNSTDWTYAGKLMWTHKHDHDCVLWTINKFASNNNKNHNNSNNDSINQEKNKKVVPIRLTTWPTSRLLTLSAVICVKI